MLQDFLLKQDVVEQLTCTLLPAIIETNWEGCEVFLKTTVSRASDGSKLKHYAIGRSVRREGKPSHEPMHYLGALTDEEAEGIRNALQAAKNPGSIFVDPSTISAEKHYGFLRLMVLHWIYTSFDLHQLLGRIRYAELLVLNRAVDPKSKAGLFEWACATACPAFLGVPRSAEIDFEVYRDLDRLAKMQDCITAHIYSELKRKGKASDPRLVYDITATYIRHKMRHCRVWLCFREQKRPQTD